MTASSTTKSSDKSRYSDPLRSIIIRSAREHNLKDLSVEIPRDRMVVITGLSGSGKSSLAFDTIFAEGQRRYVESLSAYARQFLEQMQKPAVESIEGLPPTIAIEQRSGSASPRSTVATTTEIYDFLRLLYARCGTPYCYQCGRLIAHQSAEQIVRAVMAERDNGSRRVMLLAPLVRGRKGEHADVFRRVRVAGFVRVRVDGIITELANVTRLAKNRKHDLDVVVDRLILREGIESRLTDSLETALKLGEGLLVVSTETACRVAAELGWSVEHELAYYIVHGLLHLAGYDDTTSAGRTGMRREERRVMKFIGFPAPPRRPKAVRRQPNETC